MRGLQNKPEKTLEDLEKIEEYKTNIDMTQKDICRNIKIINDENRAIYVNQNRKLVYSNGMFMATSKDYHVAKGFAFGYNNTLENGTLLIIRPGAVPLYGIDVEKALKAYNSGLAEREEKRKLNEDPDSVPDVNELY